MDLTIYEPLSRSINTDGLGTLTHFVDDPKVTESNDCILEFSYLMDGQCAEYLKRDYVIASKINNRQAIQPFVIIEAEPDYLERVIYVTARHQTIVDLMDTVIPEIVFRGMSINGVLNEVNKKLQTPNLNIRLATNMTGTLSAEYKDSNAYDLLIGDKDSVLNLSNAEMELIDGGLTFKQQRGRKNALQISKGNSLIKKLAVTHDREDVVTRIIPTTTLMNDYAKRGERGNYSRDTKKEKVYGQPVTSKMIDQGYPVITRFVEYRNEKLDDKYNETVVVEKATNDKEKDKTVKLNHYEFEKVEQLDEVAKNYFTENQGVDQEKITASLDVIPSGALTDELKELNCYDTVFIYDEKYEEDVELMVTQTTYNPLTEEVESVKFNSKRTSSTQASAVINNGKPSRSELETLSGLLNNAYNNSNTVNFVTKDDGTILGTVSQLPDPSEAKEGDVVFLDSGDKTEIYEFKNGAWERLVGTNDINVVREEIERIQKQWDDYDKQQTEIDERNEQRLQEANDRMDAIIANNEKRFDENNQEIQSLVDNKIDQSHQATAEQIAEANKAIKEVSDRLIGQSDNVTEQLNSLREELSANELSTDEVNDMIQSALKNVTITDDVRNQIIAILREEGLSRSDVEAIINELAVNRETFDEVVKRQDADINNAWKEATDGKTQADFALEMIGQPEHTEYGTNIVDGDTTVSSSTGVVTVKSQHSLENDKPYTLSFKLECLIPREANFTLNFKDKDSNVKQTDTQLPTADATVVIKHEQPQVQSGNLTLNFKDNDSNVQQTDAQLATGDATIVIKHR